MGALLLYIDVKDCPKPVSSTTPPRNRDKMIFSNVAGGQTVLLVWADLGPDPKHFQDSVEQLQSLVGVSQKVSVENVERLGLANYQPGHFDKIFSGCVGLATINHDLDRLGQLTKLLKPGGQLSFVQCVRAGEDPASLSSSLILSGLTSSSSSPPTLLQSFPCLEATLAKLGLSQANMYLVTGVKPNHEVGASRLLSFAKPKSTPAPAPASVWTLEDLEDDSVELVDDKTLLSEEDLVKPDPSTLRVCGTTGKRKACKDCSCGLREELDAGNEVKKKDFTSSCGSCYLGDAFRCGSCPYLGMPAFNPGDKITLSERQLNPDLKQVA